MNQDRAAFEQLDFIVLVGRHLAERLAAEIFLRTRVHRIEQADAIGTADLLQSPADPKVAHQPLRKWRNPAERGDLDVRIRIDCHACSYPSNVTRPLSRGGLI